MTRGWGKPAAIGKYAGGVDRRTVYGWLAAGLPFSRLPSGRILISYGDVDKFLAGFRVDKARDENVVEEMMEGLG